MKAVERFLFLRTTWVRVALAGLFLYEAVYVGLFFSSFLDQVQATYRYRDTVGEFDNPFSNRVDLGLEIAILVGISALVLASIYSAATIFRRPRPYICMVACLLPCSFPSGWEHCYINIVGFLMLYAVLNPPIFQQKSPSPSGNGLSDP